jgi:16S rRNA (cytidine1402-2'-O)-methyltransferase
MIAEGVQDSESSLSRFSRMFEETQRGTLEELIAHFTAQNPKGEIVVIVAGLQE